MAWKHTLFISFLFAVLTINAKTATDTLERNAYGHLLDDDSVYNPREHWLYPAIKVMANNVVTWSIDRYALNAYYSKVSMVSWGNNIRRGWWWDNDPIQPNFIGHPYSGGLSYAGARSSGYGFYSSFAFTTAGSLAWEYFGENEQPSYNDIISTPVAGVFFGEIIHRISSNILDDRTKGAERVFRELFAGFVDPMRGASRLIQGRTKRRLAQEVYQKEPMDIGIYLGGDVVNRGTMFGTGNLGPAFRLVCLYGDAFEDRRRKPFDLFKLDINFVYHKSSSPLDNILGYGLLKGNTIKDGDRRKIFLGGFQYFDYWNDHFFELSTIGIGAGLISRHKINTRAAINNSFSISAVPLAAFNLRYGIDEDPERRKYSYSGGIQAKLETGLSMNQQAYLSMAGYGYLTRGYYGGHGDNLTFVLRPSLNIRVFKGFNVGIQHLVFYNKGLSSGSDGYHLACEQRILIGYYWNKIAR